MNIFKKCRVRTALRCRPTLRSGRGSRTNFNISHQILVRVIEAERAHAYRRRTDCTSADECDPDENWIEEARAALETNEIKSKSK